MQSDQQKNFSTKPLLHRRASSFFLSASTSKTFMKKIFLFSLFPLLWSAPFSTQAHHNNPYFDGYIDISHCVPTEVTANNPCHSCGAFFQYIPRECGIVSFTNQSASSSSTSYLWDFGDGQTSTTASPTHLYTTNGNYQVCLSITDRSCVDQICTTLSVLVDNDPPLISCVQAIPPYSTQPGACTAKVFLGTTAADHCKFSLTGTRSDGLNCNALFPLEITGGHYLAADKSGNTHKCGIGITVEDRKNMDVDFFDKIPKATRWLKQIRDSFFIKPCLHLSNCKDKLRLSCWFYHRFFTLGQMLNWNRVLFMMRS